MKEMRNYVKAIIIVVVLTITVFAVLLVVSNKLIYSDILGNKTEVGDIKIGDEVYVVNTTIDESTIIKGTVIEVKYQDKKVVEYSILLPRVINSEAIYSVVFFGLQENIFLTYNQALKYLLNN